MIRELLPSREYQRFVEEIKHKNRFCVNPKFIELLKTAINLNASPFDISRVLFRARIHGMNDPKNIAFSGDDMLNPPSTEAKRGRANPDGVSYLYLSSDIETCIAEVTPKYNDILTIGEFSLKRKLNLINLEVSFPCHSQEYITELNHCIRLTFSLPPSERPEIDYVPYQFICELIKNEKYDGVLYRSCYDSDILTNSYNVVLFDSTLLKIEEAKFELIKITSVKYEWDQPILHT